jgi:hypothetical protein
MWCHLLSALAVVATLADVGYAQFDTIINVPPDRPPGEIESNTQLNLFDGGSITRLDAGPSGNGTNIEVNVFGGTGFVIWAYRGSRLDISGGVIGVGIPAFRTDRVITVVWNGIFV